MHIAHIVLFCFCLFCRHKKIIINDQCGINVTLCNISSLDISELKEKCYEKFQLMKAINVEWGKDYTGRTVSCFIQTEYQGSNSKCITDAIVNPKSWNILITNICVNRSMGESSIERTKLLGMLGSIYLKFKITKQFLYTMNYCLPQHTRKWTLDKWPI